MPFNGSGGFTRLRNWVADAAAAIKIRADYHDSEDDGFAVGLSNAICKDGQTTITQNIPFNAKRITGLGDPVDAQDAMTKAAFTASGDAAYVKKVGDIMTGQLQASASTGGIASAAGGRQGLEVKGDGSGAAFMSFHRPSAFAGYFGIDTDNIWKIGGYSHGNVAHQVWHAGNHNPAAYLPLTGGTVTGYMQANAALRAAGNLWVNDSIQADTANLVLAANGGSVYLRPHGVANGTNETRVGSDGYLYVTGGINCNGNVQGGGNLLLGANSNHIYFRPYGVGNATNQGTYQTDGNMTCAAGIFAPYLVSTSGVYGGLRCKNGASGGSGGNVANMIWVPGYGMGLFVDDTYLGIINAASDYRIKKDVAPLGDMWEVVKRYRPISYTHQEWTPTPVADSTGKTKAITEPLVEGDDIERWGFIAHELQEATISTAASGVKDQVNCIQSPNPWTMLAAVVKTLQEAQARIETLETQIAALEAA